MNKRQYKLIAERMVNAIKALDVDDSVETVTIHDSRWEEQIKAFRVEFNGDRKLVFLIE